MSTNRDRGATYDPMRLAEATPELRKRHITSVELSALWRISRFTAEAVLARMRKAGSLCRLRTGATSSVWMLPDQYGAALAKRKAEQSAMYKAKIMRSNDRQRLRRCGLDPDAEDVDDMPKCQRIVPAAEAKRIRVTAPNSVFALGAML